MTKHTPTEWVVIQHKYRREVPFAVHSLEWNPSSRPDYRELGRVGNVPDVNADLLAMCEAWVAEYDDLSNSGLKQLTAYKPLLLSRILATRAAIKRARGE